MTDKCSHCIDHQLLQSIFDTTDAALFYIDQHGIINRVNQRMLEIFHITEAQLLGQHIATAIRFDDQHNDFSCLHGLLENKEDTTEYTRTYQRADGTEFWGHIKARRILKKDIPEGIVCLITDISPQKSIEADLVQANMRFNLMSDTLPCGLYDYRLYPDGKGDYEYLSKRAEDIFELSFAEISADIAKFYQQIHPEDLPELLNKDKPAIKNNTLFTTEFRISTRSGQLKWIKLSALPNRTYADKSVLWSGYILDVTKQKELEKDLLELTVAHRISLEHERIMEDLHDGFGSQLSSAGLMAQKGRLSIPQMANILQECMEDLHIVVDTFANHEKNLHTSLVNFKYRTEQRNANSAIAFHWNIQLNTVPSLDSRSILHIMRIIQEAINNALKHAQPNNIYIAAIYSQAELMITIKDDGIGMPDVLQSGRGLRNMKKRSLEVGGSLHFENTHPGTQICFILQYAI